jgi:hypothetical protein
MTPDDDKKTQAHKISKIFTYIGGTLIFFGITYLLFNNWLLLASVGRIALTLGVACWVLTIAVSITKQNKNTASSAVLFTIGGLLLPFGLYVTLNALGMRDLSIEENIISSGICFTVFLILQLRFPREVLLFFTALFGSLFFIACTNMLNAEHHWLAAENLIDYQMIGLGLSYLLGAYLVSFKNRDITGGLYFFGDLLILFGSFHLAGLLFEGATFFAWEFIAPVLLLLSFLISIPLTSKPLLYLSATFLVIYLTSMTHKYAYLFGSLAWPFVLIIAGVVLMLLGFIIVNIPRKDD